jgi:hypothetical protein
MNITIAETQSSTESSSTSPGNVHLFFINGQHSCAWPVVNDGYAFSAK